MTLHEDLERELAAFKGTEAALTFQSGFTANTGVIPTITGEQDLIVSDALNHASIIDGMRLSKAPRKVYPHADVDGPARDPRRGASSTAAPGTGQPYRLILVVTDGVFSMDGDIAPLPGIVEAAEAAGAAVFVDDAHASGVLGRDGRGSVDHFGLHGRVAIQVGTLSKAVGVLGGYVAGSQDLRDILIQRARPFLFSTSHPPAVAAACREAIRVMQDEPELHRAAVGEHAALQGASWPRLGFDTGRSETPITPVMMGDPDDRGPLQPAAVRGGRLRPAGRLPDRRPGQGADPDDRDRCPCRRAARPRARGVRRGRSRARPDRRVTGTAREPERARRLRRPTCPSTRTSTRICRPTATSRSTPTPPRRSSARIAELAITDHVDFVPGDAGLRLRDVRRPRADRPGRRRALGARRASRSGSGSRSRTTAPTRRTSATTSPATPTTS